MAVFQRSLNRVMWRATKPVKAVPAFQPIFSGTNFSRNFSDKSESPASSDAHTEDNQQHTGT